MKHTLIVLAAALAAALPVGAQDRIYRCGNEYTNQVSQAKERGCRLVEGGNVTVLQATPRRAAPAATPSAPAAAASASPAGAPRVATADQRARDADARAILEDELRKAESRLAELRREYNDGAPQRTALELRNPQGYLERTAELKAGVARAEADVAGIRRELGRLNR
ncbi:hypothetical protein SAMN05428957_1019 [Oryzisolibacter propanilivorax]|uniref:DUF4124 domain-containing protein n=1 Tax=Oryzisolibacter propanilivorax TaxID=1527607 RepID=A0A1G9NVY3_9BURK|nr:hypothetical protein [Oryzisolibacter propanilivorax]SDL90187.1 hypothetical protein SAMN05428957_1019 [Oryzisolibacter propanilivorax]